MPALAHIKITSFGFKYGKPSQANLLFDMRFIKNPYYLEQLRPLSGEEPAVAEFILAQSNARHFLSRFSEQLKEMLPGFLANGHDHETLVIAFGCTGGKHRSVCMAIECQKLVRAVLEELSLSSQVELQHRDLGRE
jgi:UPF0042 nucleotide-binding protein